MSTPASQWECLHRLWKRVIGWRGGGRFPEVMGLGKNVFFVLRGAKQGRGAANPCAPPPTPQSTDTGDGEPEVGGAAS